MEKHFEHNGSSLPPQAEPDVTTVLKRIQQQLVFLEKKIDTLINRSTEKPSKEQHFSKPFRSYGRSHQPGKRKYYNGSREGGFNQGRRFGREESGGNRRFDQGKKPFFPRRKKRT